MKKEAIPDFEEYLKTLKQLHSSGDLELLVNEAKPHVGGDTQSLMQDILRNYSDPDTLRQMERVTRLRQNLSANHMDRANKWKLRDILFLDLALESYLRVLTEKIMHLDLGFDGYIRETTIILANLALSYQWSELAVCREDWEKIVQPLATGAISEENARKIKSVVDRLKQSLGEVTDQMQLVLQAKGELLGKEFGLGENVIKTFSEEITRGKSKSKGCKQCEYYSLLHGRLWDRVSNYSANLWQVSLSLITAPVKYNTVQRARS